MENETKREILLLLSLMVFAIEAIIFIYNVALYNIVLHWEPFWLQLKLYWVHLAITTFMGFLLLWARKEIPKKTNLPGQITVGKLYAGQELNRQRKFRR
ncbi:MAG: hypothetical protein AAB949_00785 [Patescibacteria group bacterium]